MKEYRYEKENTGEWLIKLESDGEKFSLKIFI